MYNLINRMPDSLPSIENVGRFFGQSFFLVVDKININLGHRWYSEIQILNSLAFWVFMQMQRVK